MTIKELEKKMAELDELQAETENAHVKLKAQMAELEKLQAETENAHAKLIAQMAELKERGEEKPKPPHPRWKANFGEEYFIIRDRVIAYYSSNDGFDDAMHNIGNYFSSKEEADFALERLKVLTEMREWAGKWDDTFVLTYVGNNDFVQISSVLMSRNTFGEMRFATKEDAEGCIKAVGKERLLRYYFMVPEEDDDGID